MNLIKHILIILTINMLGYSMTRISPDPDFTANNVNDYTKDVNFNFINFTSVQDFGRGNVVRKLTLEGGTITSIPNGTLPSGLLVLKFYRLPLSDISDDAFENSADTLDQLEFISTNLTRLPNALLSLNNLTSLTIIDNYIVEWDITILQHIMPNLKILILVNVGLSSFPSWFSFPNILNFVNLALNSLNFIPDGAFNSSNHTLTCLSLESTNLTAVPKALSSLTKLDQLVLSGNNIEDVDGRPGIEDLTLFPCSKTIRYLFIESIGLTVIPKLENLKTLERLKLSYNNISYSTFGSIPSSVQKLQLQVNNLSSLPTFIGGITDLSNLNLSYNRITTDISIDMFPSKSLQYLDLSHNKITKIIGSNGTKLYFIFYLYLQSNPISIISPSAFKLLFWLSELRLENTNLTELPVALSSLKKLQTLTMSPASLMCKCPSPLELGQWYSTNKVNPYVLGDVCVNGTLDAYLTYPCLEYIATTPYSGAVKAHVFNVLYAYAFILVSLVIF